MSAMWKKSVYQIFVNQKRILQCISKTQIFHLSSGMVNSANNKFHQTRKRRNHAPKFLLNGEKFKEQPRWFKKMHESLVKDVSLPLPAQGEDFFDGSHLQSYSLENLLSLVWAVVQIDKDATSLLKELWRRMDVMNVEQIVSIADIFFINNVKCSWYLSAMSIYFLEMMDIMEMTPSQLTRLTFHALDQHRSIPPGFCPALEHKILLSIDSLSLNELAVICHSFFTSQTRICSMDLLDKMSIKLIQEFNTLNHWYLPVFMKTMRFSNFIKISFYKDLGDMLEEKKYLDKFHTLAQIMHIAHTYASVRISHPAFFTYMLQTCVNPKYNFRLKDLSKLVWSCGTLITDCPKDVSAIEKILKYLEYNLSLKEILHHPDNLVDLVNGLCFLNIRSDFLLNLLFHPRNVTAIIGMGENKIKLPQFNIISHCVAIEHSSYSGNRLDENSKTVIASLLGKFSLENEMFVKKGLRQALEALQHLLGKDKVLCTNNILPHFQMSDIFLVWDAVGSQFTRPKAIDWTSNQRNERYIHLAVLLGSNMQTSYDGKPLGMLCMKIRQLKVLGYQPVLVDANDALGFAYCGMETTQRSLLSKMSQALNTPLDHLISS